MTPDEAEVHHGAFMNDPEVWFLAEMVRVSLDSEAEFGEREVPDGCELCGYPDVDAHRLKPGRWGGTYDPWNVAYLCPNHHRAVHFLMRLRLRGGSRSDRESRLLEFLERDAPLGVLFQNRVLPFVVERIEGRGARRSS